MTGNMVLSLIMVKKVNYNALIILIEIKKNYAK